jgi:hypothetical protein
MAYSNICNIIEVTRHGHMILLLLIMTLKELEYIKNWLIYLLLASNYHSFDILNNFLVITMSWEGKKKLIRIYISKKIYTSRFLYIQFIEFSVEIHDIKVGYSYTDPCINWRQIIQNSFINYTRWHARVLPWVYKTNTLNNIIIVNQC